jgi:hypothetical protein
MKKKVLNHKLSLNKKTVVNLNNGEMINLKGGYLTQYGNTCPVTVCPGCLSLNLTECIDVCAPTPPFTA